MKAAVSAVAIPTALFLAAWRIAVRLEGKPPRPLFSDRLAPEQAEGVRVPDVGTALTFARVDRGGRLAVVRVRELCGGVVRGVDLCEQFPEDPADPITLFNRHGYAALAAANRPEVAVPASSLTVPFDGTDAQIAMGINYPAHGAETDVAAPFVLAKLNRPGGFMDPVSVQGSLLDYEVELGFVALDDVARGTRPATMGLVLAGDYTDRATLLRRVNVFNPASGDGFTAAKSKPGFMPIGTFLVIPADVRSYYRALKLELYVNGEKRQLAEPRLMTWDLDMMLDRSFARATQTWRVDGATVSLPIGPHGIPARTILLSGTSDGVVFRRPSARQILIGVAEYVFGARWANPRHVVEPAIAEARRGRWYLQPGDTVLMRGDGLGIIQNRIVD